MWIKWTSSLVCFHLHLTFLDSLLRQRMSSFIQRDELTVRIVLFLSGATTSRFDKQRLLKEQTKSLVWVGKAISLLICKDRSKFVCRVVVESARTGHAFDGLGVSIEDNIKNNTFVVGHKTVIHAYGIQIQTQGENQIKSVTMIVGWPWYMLH